MSRLLTSLLAGLVVLAFTATAFAGIPDATLSTVSTDDDCVFYCPLGDGETATLTVTARNAAGDPLPGIQAADIHFNLGGAPGIVTAIDSETQADGTFDASFDLTAGDCDAFTITITIYTTTMIQTLNMRARDVDMNHSGCVDGTDGASFGLEWNTTGPCADFNCSNLVDGTDGAIFGLHWAHNCP
jgi:hypothetical protein